ncbi:MAG: CapA family protein [Deltaproteobacteria bacterium]|nr:CapA family protein [Deltaproteobacteria bacterium]
MQRFRHFVAPVLLLLAACAAKPESPPAGPAPQSGAIPEIHDETEQPVPVTVLPVEPESAARHGAVTIAAAGDVTLGNHFKVFDPELKQKRGLTGDDILDYPFLHVRKWFREADIAIVNYEGTFTTSTEKTVKNFTFKADPHEVDKLKRAGIDVVSLANNHASDFGETGLRDTARTLDQAGILHFGAGENLAAARRPARLEANGLGVCFTGYLYLGLHSIEPDVVWAGEAKSGVAGVPSYEGNEADMAAMLTEDLAAMGNRRDCDFRVVFFHWGREGTHELMPYQRELATIAVQHGADAVLGAHPHVLQAVEYLEGPAGLVPVIYSMGNFVFAGNWNPKRKDSVIALLLLEITPEGRRRTMEFVPVYSDRYPEFPFQPWPQAPEKAEKTVQRMLCWAQAATVEECE